MQFIYFGRRDRKAVDIVGIAPTEAILSEVYQMDDIAKHKDNIPADKLQKLIMWQRNRLMDWQLYVENFKDFNDFREKLTKRGFKGLPNYGNPLLFNAPAPVVELNKPANKTMLQRKRS